MAGRPCTVCNHPKRREIELAAARGASARSISLDFGVTDQSLGRHMKAHASRAIEKAAAAAGIRDLASGLGLNEEMVSLQDRTLEILARAEKDSKTLSVAVGAIREARCNLELLGKLTGKLRPDTQVNVLVTSPDWLAMRERIASALEPYPEARADVLRAISEGE